MAGSSEASGRQDASVMALVGSAHFSSHLLQLVLPPLFPILHLAFGVSFLELGLVVTLFYVTSGLGQATAGVLVDRYGAHRLLVCGLATLASAVIAMGFVSDYAMMLPLAVIAGLGNSVFHPADLSILSHRVSTARLGRGYAVHALMGSIGFASSPLLVGAIAAIASSRVALVVAGSIGLLVAGILALRRPLLVYEKAVTAPQHAPGAPQRIGYLAMIGSLVVLLAFGYFFLTAVAGAGIQTFAISALTRGYGLALDVATWGLTAYLVGSAFGMIAGGFLADRTDKHHRVAMTGIAVAAIFMAAIAVVPNLGIGAIALLCAAGIASGVTAPSRDVIIRRTAASAGAGTGSVFGFVYSGLDLGSSLAPMVFGALVDHDATHVVFLAIAASFALAAPTVMQVQQRAAARQRVAAAVG